MAGIDIYIFDCDGVIVCPCADIAGGTRLYPGVKRLLRVLREKGKSVVLLTDRLAQSATLVLRELGVLDCFDLIIASDTEDDDGNAVEGAPSSDGLELALRLLNRRNGTAFTPANAIMIGDSADDIIAGRAFGCMTAGCRDGLGDRERMLAEHPDLCFFVACEIEKFTDILSDGRNDSGARSMADSAMRSEIPIAQGEGVDFICGCIKAVGATSILEIGTAIGCSAIRFAEVAPDIHVTTIEIDGGRCAEAVRNVEERGLSGRVSVIHGDALTVELDERFDLIFIDAAKAQYLRFFEKFKRNLTDGGVIICDNLSFHGMVEDLSLTRSYSTKKLVKKIRRFREFLRENDEFETQFLDKGDGISVSRRIKKI